MRKLFLYSLVLIYTLLISVVEAAQSTVFPLLSRTSTTTSANIYKTTEVGAHFILNVTVAPGVETLTMKIQGMDFLGNYYDLLVGTASAATGIVVLKVSPSIGAIPNGSATDMIPDVYRVIVTHSGGGAWTYSVTENAWSTK